MLVCRSNIQRSGHHSYRYPTAHAAAGRRIATPQLLGKKNAVGRPAAVQYYSLTQCGHSESYHHVASNCFLTWWGSATAVSQLARLLTRHSFCPSVSQLARLLTHRDCGFTLRSYTVT